jgi:TPR repeat protein
MLAAATASRMTKTRRARCFEHAAARGEPAAQWSLGVFHEEGAPGFEVDLKEAVRLVAARGRPGSALRAGQARDGVPDRQGVQSSLVEGYAWIAASDVPEAKPMLKEIEKKMVAPLLAKAQRLADERRALRTVKPQPRSPALPPPPG